MVKNPPCNSGDIGDEISIDDGVVRVLSSPVKYVGVSTDTRLLFAKSAKEDFLTDTNLDIKWYLDLAGQGINNHRYIRITLVDEFGNRAYSRAYSYNEIMGEIRND